jgi:propionyl-CoA carboxylase beta chain
VPADPNKPYDIKRVIEAVVDDGSFLEVHAAYARNIVVGFARLRRPERGRGGQPAGLPGRRARHRRLLKGARFVRFCDAFNIPLVTFEDVPGFLPGTQQEFGGIIKHGAKLLYAYAEATVPKITVITRKAYGGAYCVMASKHLRTDVNLAYPRPRSRSWAPRARSTSSTSGSSRRPGGRAAELRAELVAEYRKKFSNPYVAAELGFLDGVIEPRPLVGCRPAPPEGSRPTVRRPFGLRSVRQGRTLRRSLRAGWGGETPSRSPPQPSHSRRPGGDLPGAPEPSALPMASSTAGPPAARR